MGRSGRENACSELSIIAHGCLEVCNLIEIWACGSRLAAVAALPVTDLALYHHGANKRRTVVFQPDPRRRHVKLTPRRSVSAPLIFENRISIRMPAPPAFPKSGSDFFTSGNMRPEKRSSIANLVQPSLPRRSVNVRTPLNSGANPPAQVMRSGGA